MKYKALPVFLIATLFACKLSAQQSISPATYPAGGNNKVVFFTDYYADYIKSLRAGCKNRDSLFVKKIQYPIMHTFKGCEYFNLVGMSFFYPIYDTAGLEHRISIIKNYSDKITKIVTGALVKCNQYLKNDSVTIYITPSDGGFMKSVLRKMGGVTGVTAGKKQIVLTLDPDTASWMGMIANCLTHEYNHAYWTEMNFAKTKSWNMLSYLVFEGRADSYAHFIYPDVTVAWDKALNDTEKENLWKKIKPQLQDSDETFQRNVMFGYGGYPMWGGYTLGFSIVQSALKNHPNLKPEEWANLSPEEILALSDYK